MTGRGGRPKKEPTRARRVSERTKQRMSSSDIKEAFKMASTIKGKMSNISSVSEKEMVEVPSLTENNILKEQQEQPIALTTSQHSSQESLLCADNTELLEAIHELTQKFSAIESTIHDPVKGIAQQVLNLNLRCDSLYSDIHGEDEGVLSKMENCLERVEHVEGAQTRLSSLLAENKRLAQDLLTTQGLLQKYSQKIKMMEKKILDLTKRGMEQNIIIHGIDEFSDPQKEIPYKSVLQFFMEKMEIQIDESDIWKAYHLGVPRKDRTRPMFVKLSYYAKDHVMENVGSLKGKKNQHSQTLFVSEQIPEGIVESRKQTFNTIKSLRKQEEQKPISQRRQVQAMGEKIIVGGEVYKPDVTTPEPFELFPSIEEQREITKINHKLKETLPNFTKNSSFIGLALEVTSGDQIKLAYKAVMQRFPYMDHVMLGYQLKLEDGSRKFGGCDDGEHGGGACIYNHLYKLKQQNIAVFVVRRYGGIHMGLDRFKQIEQTAFAAAHLVRPDELPIVFPKDILQISTDAAKQKD